MRVQAEAGLAAWQRSYIDAIAEFDRPAQAPVRISFVRSKRLFYAKMLADPTLTSRTRLREVLVHTVYGTRLRLHMRSQRPLLVALDGIDGCGKSTQAELLAQRAGAVCRTPPRRVDAWRQLGVAPADHSSGQAAGGTGQGQGQGGRRCCLRPLTRDEEMRERERAALFRHPLARAVWPWLIVLELGLSYQWRVRWPLLRGHVVVADRYVLSTLTDLAARLRQPDIARTAARTFAAVAGPATARHVLVRCAA